MYRFVLAAAVLAGCAGPAAAWNEKGHMVVARLAWKELKADERDKVLAVLNSHPHSDEFLKAKRPANIPEREWVFMRAATWADWVRSGPPERRAFHVGDRHYINLPFVHPPKSATPPKLPEVNVVTAIKKAREEVTGGSDQVKRAVETAWLFHLVGDVHQPLHCATLFGPDFKTGDRGGTRARFRLENRLVPLHSFWDGLLGQSTSLSGISTTVLEIETLQAQFPDAVAADLANHTTAEEWAQEGLAAAREFGYLNGNLPLANSDDDPDVTDIARAPEGYEETAGEVARFAAWKAGKRLAAVLREVMAHN